MAKPVVSVGIIFKNEVRCLERCLRSLQPLREAVSCEVVMADTGADDGSREVAERYADILIDFPWINDFSAARNAVMDRCSGKWFLSMDADEWLDEDVRELAVFLQSARADAGFVVVRNYMTEALDNEYQDSMLARLLRLSAGLRFEGAIHEKWDIYRKGFRRMNLSKTILHHDGYVGLNSAKGKDKRERNMTLLRAELERNPQSLRTILECIESSRPDPDHVEYIRRGLEGIQEQWSGWQGFGPPVCRYAVYAAKERYLPELDEWIALAEERFPKSFYTTIDVAYFAVLQCWDKGDYEECASRAEGYFKAIADFRAGRGDQNGLLYSSIGMATSRWEEHARGILVRAYLKSGRVEQVLDTLDKLEAVDGDLVQEFVRSLREMQISTDEDTAPLMRRFHARLAHEPDEKRARDLQAVFLQAAPLAFSPAVREKEAGREDFHRYSYTLFLPLAGQCEAGTAAAVMEAADLQEMEALLGKVEKWGDFPISALLYALEQGVVFPPRRKPLRIEEMDGLARRLRQYGPRFFALIRQAAELDRGGDWQRLAWHRALALAGIRSCDWKDKEQGMLLARSFAGIEGEFVARCYAPELLCEENIYILPPMHRFGWYCGRAFEALDAGRDAAGYVRLLRLGLEFCPGMKPMVEFLTEHTPELQVPPPSGELLALAEQVRAMLAAYPADDPAAVMLKQSAAYQRVAHLIEGPEAGMFGGLAQ